MVTKNNKLVISKKDLFTVHSYAIDASKELSGQSSLFQDPQNLMAYCWLLGVYKWLRSKNLIDKEIEYT